MFIREITFFNINDGIIILKDVTLEKIPIWGQIHIFKENSFYLVLCIGKQGSGLCVFDVNGKLIRITQIPSKYIYNLQPFEIAENLYNISCTYHGEENDS